MKIKQIFQSCLIFLVIFIIFNNFVVRQIFTKSNYLPVNDEVITEFLNETSYQNILNGKDPFVTDKLFYPFKTDFTLLDSSLINMSFFFLLRPIMRSYNLMYLIVFVNIFLSYILTYLLLNKLKIKNNIAILSALVFSFTPFLSHRIFDGHLSYTSTYFFPLLFLIAINFLNSSDIKVKYLCSLLFGFFLGLLFYASPFYFIATVITILYSIVILLLILRWIFIKFFFLNFKYFVLMLIVSGITLLPIINKIIQSKSILTINTSFLSSITLSADLSNFFIPNYYNPFYLTIYSQINNISPILTKLFKMFINSDNGFAYPGVLIICTYIFLLILFKKNKIQITLFIKFLLLESALFFVLTLGPLLKIFNRWSVNLDGVPLIFPLPYLFFKYIPILNTIRAPIRFLPIFIFFSTVLFAIVLNKIFYKLSKNKQSVIFIIIFLVFIIDQFYIFPKPQLNKIPLEIYSFLKKENSNKVVLEIPFTVRDGLRYEGFVHAVLPMRGSLIHNKPIIGGYLARINQEVFDYYKKVKIIDYFGNIIDKGNFNPRTENPKEVKIVSFKGTLDEANKEFNQNNIKYIVLKNDEKYSQAITEIILEINFKRIKKDGNYDLFILKY